MLRGPFMTTGLPLQEHLGFRVHNVTMDEAVEYVAEAIASRRPTQILQVNFNNLLTARADPELRRIYASAQLLTADGKGLIFGGIVLGKPFREMVSGFLLMERLLQEARDPPWRIFFLGAAPEVLRDAVANAQRLYPNIVIAGSHHGYWKPDQEQQVVDLIAASQADILLVGMSTPLKERFIHRQYQPLGVPVCMGVGGSLDVLAGRARVAPLWLRRCGLEWTLRIFYEPRRMWRRYCFGIPRYAGLVASELVANRYRQASPSH
jgi:N-acetylglucosaminyldiphosphoundecaprenol N-acetyl-beta-D-mannosaminyltransferase